MTQPQLTRLLIVVVLVGFCAINGCHRSYYRRQADAEAQRLIQQKANDPRWASSDGSIDIDPYSRMFNPFSSDHPPIPPDDPASHQLMHCVDGKQGFPHWHANGDTDYVENPDWKSYLPVNEKGQLVLTLDRAYQLALLHSTDLQQQIETLYLSALDVSLERFGFDTQLFAGFNSFFTSRGRFRTGTGQSSSTISADLGANSEGIQMSRLGTTGANFVVGIANTILFNFSGNNTQSATSLINFSVIQPLLRGAGRDRIMESLTQNERTLLANVRQMDRFRRGFYLQVATGRNPGAGPNRAGSFLILPSGAPIGVGGFYGLLFQQQQIRNQEFIVRQLEAVLEQFREFFLRDRLDALQLKQFESTVYGQQAVLVRLRIQYQASVDRFNQTIGLPPDLEVVIQDDFLDRFNLISDEVNNRLIQIGLLRQQSGATLSKVGDLLPVRPDQLEGSDFQWSAELGNRISAMQPFLEQAQEMLTTIKQDDIQQLQADLKKMESTRADRIAYLRKLAAAIESGAVVSAIDPSLYAAQSIPTTDELRLNLDNPGNNQNILNRLAAIEGVIRETQQRIANIENEQTNLNREQLYETISLGILNQIPELLSDLNNVLLDLTLIQARARSNSIEISDVDIDAETATEIARCFRRDWMNARASLVDNWRRIEFVADQLESQVDLVFQGEIGNVGDNPFKLRYETGQLRAGFRFDSPLVRLAERNNYRQTLIQYQQTRRQYYLFEDEVKRNLRDIVRTLNRDKLLFELNRRTVLVQIETIELNRLALEEPTAVNATTTQFGDTTARNLADAFNNLNSAQDQFTGNWIEYEILRRSLDFDMGTMQLDEQGAWIDPGLIDNTIGARAAAAMGIELDCQFCSDAVIYPVVIQRISNESDETFAAPDLQPENPTTEAKVQNGDELKEEADQKVDEKLEEKEELELDSPPFQLNDPESELDPAGQSSELNKGAKAEFFSGLRFMPVSASRRSLTSSSLDQRIQGLGYENIQTPDFEISPPPRPPMYGTHFLKPRTSNTDSVVRTVGLHEETDPPVLVVRIPDTIDENPSKWFMDVKRFRPLPKTP